MNEQPQQHTIGKGDTQRPFNGETFRDNYDDIFRKKDKQQQPTNNDNNGKAIQESDHKP
jgi:hypothetical protein